VKGDLILICNGEIYNYKELYALMKSADGSPVIPKTQSDCEVILWLYERYGIEQTLQMLDGVFAFALLDQRYQLGESTLYIARDPYGVRPLYSIHQNTKSPAWLNSETTIGFASELKVLSGFARTPERISEAITEVKSVGVRGHNEVTREDLRNAVGLARTPERISEATSVGVRGLSREDLSSKDNVSSKDNETANSTYTAKHFPPGTYSKYVFSDKVCSEWALVNPEASIQPTKLILRFSSAPLGESSNTYRYASGVLRNIVYHKTAFCNIYESSIFDITKGIQKYLVRAVEKRCATTERPIACLLSGGLDSSLIAALVNSWMRTNRPTSPPLETYSIGLAESTDLRYARMVADHLGTNHHEIILTEQEFCEAIPEVIRAIESYDTTTVRASIGNYLLGKYIAANSEAKVIFNGDGSDELLGGYLYMGMAPDPIEFDRECRRLLADIHAFDVLRSDKSISSHGLEPRTPFLDREWTQFYLSISPSIRYRPGEMEKSLLRDAFSRKNYGYALLPEEVLMRRKEAFSDGVSGHERSLYQVLQEYSATKCEFNISDSYEKCCHMNPFMKNVTTNLPKTAEQFYYRSIFEYYYGGHGEVVPYFWMPKYIEANDASARTLATYHQS
jgi:asparagine synthetase B (glutamine-hydrolysing)